MVVPVYEREMAGVYYNTAAVLDADGTYLGKYRKNHIPQTNRVLGEVLLQAGQPRLSGVPDAYAKIGVYICYDRHFPEGARAARAERRRDRLQPVGDGRRALAVPVEARAARARGRQRLLHGLHQPRRHRGAVEHRQVLRHRRTSSIRAATSSRQAVEDKDELDRRRARAGHDRGGAPHLAVLPRPPAGHATTCSRRIADAHADPGRHGRHGERHVRRRRLDRQRQDRRAARRIPRAARPISTIDATGKYVIPGGIDATRTSTCRSAAPTASDDFDTGTVAAAHGGTTTIVDFAIQKKGGSLRAGARRVAREGRRQGRDRLRLPHDHDRRDRRPCSRRWAAMVREGVTSFKMFMAYPGVFLLDDQRSSAPCCAPASSAR